MSMFELLAGAASIAGFFIAIFAAKKVIDNRKLRKISAKQSAYGSNNKQNINISN